MAKNNAAAAKPANKSDKRVEGVLMLIVRPELVDAALARIGAEVRPGAQLPERVAMLQVINRRDIPIDDQIECTHCNGISPESSARCPFCGDVDPAATEVQLAEIAAEDAGIASIRAAAGANAAPKIDAGAGFLDSPGELAPEVQAAAVVASEAIAPKKSKKVAKAELVPAAETKLAVVPPVAMQTMGPATDRLDEANHRIIKLKGDVTLNYWQIGRELGLVFDEQLWLARPDKKGTASAYKSFEQYVGAELGFHVQMAYRMIKVAKEYTPELIERVGFTKLSLVISAPPDVRDELLEEVERENLSVRETDKRVRKEQKKQAGTGAKASGHPTRGGARPGAGRPPKERMTVASVEGTRRIPLYAKPAQKLAPGEVPQKRAKRLGDQPMGFEELSNGVFVYYAIVNTAGGWALKVETRRNK